MELNYKRRPGIWIGSLLFPNSYRRLGVKAPNMRLMGKIRLYMFGRPGRAAPRDGKGPKTFPKVVLPGLRPRVCSPGEDASGICPETRREPWGGQHVFSVSRRLAHGKARKCHREFVHDTGLIFSPRAIETFTK